MWRREGERRAAQTCAGAEDTVGYRCSVVLLWLPAQSGGRTRKPRGSRRVVLVEASLRVFPIFSFSSNSCLPSASAAITVRSFPAASAVITPRRGWAPSKKLDRREGVRAHVRLPLQAPSRIQAPHQCSRCTARRCLPSGHHPVPLVLEIDPPAHALADHTDGVKQCGCHWSRRR